LTVLDVSGTAITDGGLRELTVLQNLSELILDGTRVSDTGVKELAKLKSLRTLDLSSTDVTNKGLIELARLRNLEMLSVHWTKITDSGVSALLKSVPELQVCSSESPWLAPLNVEFAGMPLAEALDIISQLLDVRIVLADTVDKTFPINLNKEA